nr:hypothetical protein [Tanacetum cinerariifolium]
AAGFSLYYWMKLYTASTIVDVAELKTFSSINLYMADLKFVDQHNMVASLKKKEENAEFHQIVYFLSTCSINYALTGSPTIYASYIEQFWNTAISKTVNSVKQIHAIVDGKAVVISKSSVRSDLLFNDEDAHDSDNIAKTQSMAMSIDPISQEIGSGDRPRCKETTLGGADAQTRFETASKRSSDLPLSTGHIVGSGEDRMEQETNLIDFVPPTPHDSPLSGGHIPGSDEGRVETSTDKSLGEDAYKKRRNDDQTEELNLTNGADTEVIVEDKGSGEKSGSTADQVSTARPEGSGEKSGSSADQVSTARPEVSAATPSTPPTTTTIFGDEDLTIAQTLIKIKSQKAKEKGVAFKDEELVELDRAQKERQKQEEATIAALTKEFDEFQARTDANHELAQEEATIAALTKEFDEFQARTDANHELAVRMTHEEQEMYTIEERARLLAEYFERRKKQLAAERVEAIRNKPPTRTQVRNMMITYLKHIDSEKEENKLVENESKDKKGKRIKRVADSTPKQKSSKKQKMMQEQELAKRNVDMEDKHVYKIIIANGNISYHKSLSSMLRKFDRQDLVDLHRLVMKRFEDNTPEEKRYPLIKEMLEKMLNWKLEAKAECTMHLSFPGLSSHR